MIVKFLEFLWNPNDEMRVNFTRDYFEQMLTSTNNYIERHPTIPSTWMKKGVAYLGLRRFQEAIKCFNIVLEIDSFYVDALFYKASTLLYLSFYDEAIKCFNEILEGDPNSVEALNNQGYAYAKLNDYDQSLFYFDRGLELHPQNAALIYNKACIYALQGDLGKSINALDFALLHEPLYRHMAQKDPDFTSISMTEAFRTLINKDTE